MLLPVYLVFLGVEPSKTFAYASAAFIVLIAFLLVSRLPVYSGKRIRMSRHVALPWLFCAVVFVLFLAYYTWETLAVSRARLPASAADWRQGLFAAGKGGGYPGAGSSE